MLITLIYYFLLCDNKNQPMIDNIKWTCLVWSSKQWSKGGPLLKHIKTSFN